MRAGLSRSIGYSCKVFLGLYLFISSSCCMSHAVSSEGSFEYVHIFYRAASRYFFPFVRLFLCLSRLSFCLCFRLSLSLSIFCLSLFVCFLFRYFHFVSICPSVSCLSFLCFPFSSCFIFPTFVTNFLLHVLTFQLLFFISVCLLTAVFIFRSLPLFFPPFSFFLPKIVSFLSFFILSFFHSFKSQGFLF